jgi:hypothetical protein
VLDQDAVLQYRDLGKILPLPDDHLAHHGLTPSQELCLAEHRRTPPACFPTFASPLSLGLHSRRPVDADDLGIGCAWLTHPKNGVRRVVGGRAGLLATTAPTTAPATRTFAIGLRVAIVVYWFVLGGLAGYGVGSLAGPALGRAGLVATTTPTATTSAATTPPTAVFRVTFGCALFGCDLFGYILSACTHSSWQHFGRLRRAHL